VYQVGINKGIILRITAYQISRSPSCVTNIIKIKLNCSNRKELYPDGAHLPDRTPVQPTPTNFHSPNLLHTIGQKGYILHHFSIRR